MARIAILHPGEMGAAVGARLASTNDVCWVPTGRSAITAARADHAGLRRVADLDGCDVAMSICPPAEAIAMATRFAGFGGIYVDANAISPRTAERVAEIVIDRGGRYVDASIIGPPPAPDRPTTIYLSGADSPTVADAIAAPAITPLQIDDSSQFAASALKMVYAAWTKGSAALLLASWDSARQLGVEAALVDEWNRSQPTLPARLEQVLAEARAKGWRWVGEMLELAQTLDDTGCPASFGVAAAAVFERYPRPVSQSVPVS